MVPQQIKETFWGRELAAHELHDACVWLSANTEDWEEHASALLSRRSDGQEVWYWQRAVPRRTIWLSPLLPGERAEFLLAAPGQDAEALTVLTRVIAWDGICRVVCSAPVRPALDHWAWRSFSMALREMSGSTPLLMRACRIKFAELRGGTTPQMVRELRAELQAERDGYRLEWSPERDPWHLLDVSEEALQQIVSGQLLCAADALFESTPRVAVWRLSLHLTLASLAHRLISCPETRANCARAADVLAFMETRFDEFSEQLQTQVFGAH